MTTATSKFQVWPTAVVAVLAAQMAFGVWMTRVARDDPHFAIEPDYYARAVNWDSTMAQARKDKALGWTAQAQLTRSTGRTASLRVQLTDASGVALTNADSVTAEALAVAHAGQINTLVLQRDGDAYTTTVPVAAAGLWDVQLRARRGAELFTAKLRTELQ